MDCFKVFQKCLIQVRDAVDSAIEQFSDGSKMVKDAAAVLFTCWPMLHGTI